MADSHSNQNHIEIIDRNFTQLWEYTTCTERLLDRCVEERILSFYERESLEVERVVHKRNRLFYKHIRTVSRAMLVKLIQVMEEDGNRQPDEVLDILKNASKGKVKVTEDSDQHPNTSASQDQSPVVQISSNSNQQLIPIEPGSRLVQEVSGPTSGSGTVPMPAAAPLLETNVKRIVQALDQTSLNSNSNGGFKKPRQEPGPQSKLSPVALPIKGPTSEAQAQAAQTTPTISKNYSPITSPVVDISAFHRAVTDGDVGRVESILQQGDLDVNCKNEYGWNALHFAVQKGLQNMVEILLRNGANPNIPTVNNVTPLYRAAQDQFEGIVKVLLENGANVNAAHSTRAWTPLTWAIRNGSSRIAKLLLDNGADINTINTMIDKGTGLHFATFYGNNDIVNLLVARGAQVNALDELEWTPLHYAAGSSFNIAEIVERLIKNGANIDAKTKVNVTPLHLAACYGCHDNLKVLIQFGAAINSCDGEQMTPLHVAAENGHYECVKVLVEAKADINCKDKLGRTPLDHALSLESEDTSRELIVKYLISKGAVKGYGWCGEFLD